MIQRYLLALIVLVVTAVASASSSHETWTRAAIAKLPRFHEDVDSPSKSDQLDVIALAVAERSKSAPQSPQAWAALMLTIAHSESGLSSRIIAGDCKRHECDHGRARGIGQIWKNANNATDWERANGDVQVQVKMLDDALRRAFATCSRSGVPWVQGTINGFAGIRCGATWPGLDKRVATFNRLVGSK